MHQVLKHDLYKEKYGSSIRIEEVPVHVQNNVSIPHKCPCYNEKVRIKQTSTSEMHVSHNFLFSVDAIVAPSQIIKA